eukprot:TRINITY_DN9612_c0_g4_i1.p1 TRINITY_DN9612_c0_g4~~TRINITY_DN9612_c0_g4_i1.p1  ORF type:complete len:431 (+),score=129.89 TRINITY_DN9612_c0_g4_i1:131-1423(+)
MSSQVWLTEMNAKEGKEFSDIREESKEIRKLRAKFAASEKTHSEEYVKDLESTLQINKIMLSEVLSSVNFEETQRKILKELNNENIKLLKEIKSVTQERDDVNVKLLMAEQIITSYKDREILQSQELEERLGVLKHELESREFDLELLQQKHSTALTLLKKHTQDKDIANFLRAAVDYMPKSTTDLVNERNELSRELEHAKSRIAELEIAQHDLVTLNDQLKLSVKGMGIFGSRKGDVPVLDFTKVKRGGDKKFDDKAYIHKLEESIKHLCKRVQELEDQNKKVLQKNMQLQNSTDNFLKLNTDLSYSLKVLNDQMKALKSSQGSQQNCNRSILNVREGRASPELVRNYSSNARLGHTQSFMGNGNFCLNNVRLTKVVDGEAKVSSKEDGEEAQTKSTGKKDIDQKKSCQNHSFIDLLNYNFCLKYVCYH